MGYDAKWKAFICLKFYDINNSRKVVYINKILIPFQKLFGEATDLRF